MSSELELAIVRVAGAPFVLVTVVGTSYMPEELRGKVIAGNFGNTSTFLTRVNDCNEFFKTACYQGEVLTLTCTLTANRSRQG